MADPEGRIVVNAPPAGLKGEPMETFEIEMTRTERGKDDDPTAPVMTYEEGQTYPVGPSLYRAFVIELGCARPVGNPADERETKVAGPTETKPAGPKVVKRTTKG